MTDITLPREPTPEMVRAGHQAWDRKVAPGPLTLEKVWRAMWDAALVEHLSDKTD